MLGAHIRPTPGNRVDIYCLLNNFRTTQIGNFHFLVVGQQNVPCVKKFGFFFNELINIRAKCTPASSPGEWPFPCEEIWWHWWMPRSILKSSFLQNSLWGLNFFWFYLSNFLASLNFRNFLDSNWAKIPRISISHLTILQNDIDMIDVLEMVKISHNVLMIVLEE